MSSRPDLFEQALAGDIFEMDGVEPRTSAARESIAWNPDASVKSRSGAWCARVSSGMAEAGAQVVILCGR